MKKFKKIISLVMILVIIMSIMVVPVSAIDIAPMSIGTPITVTVGSGDIWAYDEVEVTVSFKETSQRRTPFTIEVNNGAEILVDSISDIHFVTNNVTVSIDFCEISPDRSTLTLRTGTCQALKNSYFTFYVKAPLTYANFTVNAYSDNRSEYNGSRTVSVRTGLSIIAPPVVNDVDLFTIYGTAEWKNGLPEGAYVFIDIVDLYDPEVFFVESQSNADVTNGTYTTGNTMHLTSNLPEGNYLIRAFLVDPTTWDFIGYAERIVEYVVRPDVLRVSLERPGIAQVFAIDPAPGTGVKLTGVTTNSSHYVLSSHTVTARAEIKSATEAAAATNAQFVVYTAYGEQIFAASRTGTTFFAQLNNLRTSTTVNIGGVNKEPYVV